MQIVIDIPDEQIKKSLQESKYILEDEGEHGFVNIAMLYTNARLEFVDIERKTDFYSCEYKILPKGHGRLIDADAFIDLIKNVSKTHRYNEFIIDKKLTGLTVDDIFNAVCESLQNEGLAEGDSPTIIEADKEESEG